MLLLCLHGREAATGEVVSGRGGGPDGATHFFQNLSWASWFSPAEPLPTSPCRPHEAPRTRRGGSQLPSTLWGPAGSPCVNLGPWSGTPTLVLPAGRDALWGPVQAPLSTPTTPGPARGPPSPGPGPRLTQPSCPARSPEPTFWGSPPARVGGPKGHHVSSFQIGHGSFLEPH